MFPTRHHRYVIPGPGIPLTSEELARSDHITMRAQYRKGFPHLFQLFTGWPAYPCRASTRSTMGAGEAAYADTRRVPTPCLQSVHSHRQHRRTTAMCYTGSAFHQRQAQPQPVCCCTAIAAGPSGLCHRLPSRSPPRSGTVGPRLGGTRTQRRAVRTRGAVRLGRLLRRRLLPFGWRIDRSGDRCGDPPDQPPSADQYIGVEAARLSNRDNTQNYGPHDRTTDAVTRIRTAPSIHRRDRPLHRLLLAQSRPGAGVSPSSASSASSR